MALTDRLRIVAKCFDDSKLKPIKDRLEAADNKLFDFIRASTTFPRSGLVRLLDVGSGYRGSAFVNRYGIEFPNTMIVYLDSEQFLLKKLRKRKRVCADASNMPFPAEIFNIAYVGGIIAEGVLKNHWDNKDESYHIASEAYRVLNHRGLFIFTYGSREISQSNDEQTLSNLTEIGFRRLIHLQRIIMYKSLFRDTYVAIK